MPSVHQKGLVVYYPTLLNFEYSERSHQNCIIFLHQLERAAATTKTPFSLYLLEGAGNQRRKSQNVVTTTVLLYLRSLSGSSFVFAICKRERDSQTICECYEEMRKIISRTSVMRILSFHHTMEMVHREA